MTNRMIFSKKIKRMIGKSAINSQNIIAPTMTNGFKIGKNNPFHKSLPIIFSIFISAIVAHADTTTNRLGLTVPTIGSANWGQKINGDLQILDAAVSGTGIPNAFTSSNTFAGYTQFTSTVNWRNLAHNAGQCIGLDASSNTVIVPCGTGGGGGGSPGGNSGDLQYNSGGTFGGTGGLSWTSAGSVLTLLGTLNLNNNFASGPKAQIFSSFFNTVVSGKDNIQMLAPGGVGIGIQNSSYPVAGPFLLVSPDGFGVATSSTATGGGSSMGTFVGFKAPVSTGPVANKLYSLPANDTAGSWVSDGAGHLSIVPITGTPGGSQGQIQYNQAGGFAASNNYQFSGTSVTLLGQQLVSYSNPGYLPGADPTTSPTAAVLLNGTNFAGPYAVNGFGFSNSQTANAAASALVGYTNTSVSGSEGNGIIFINSAGTQVANLGVNGTVNGFHIGTGIGQNKLDVAGGVAIGSQFTRSGATSSGNLIGVLAPVDGLAVQGNVAIGTFTATNANVVVQMSSGNVYGLYLSTAQTGGNSVAISTSGTIIINSAAANAAGTIDLTEGVAATGVAGHDLLYADSTFHGLKAINNNGAVSSVVTSSATMVAGRCVQASADGSIITTSGACGSGGGSSAVGNGFVQYSNNGILAGSPNFQATASSVTISSLSTTTDIYVSSRVFNRVYLDVRSSTMSQVNIIASTDAVVALRVSTSGAGGYAFGVSTMGVMQVQGSSVGVVNCGTSATIAGTANSFAITAGSGASGCGAVFPVGSFSKAPNCVVSQQNASVINALSYTVTNTSVTLAQTSFSGVTNVMCMGSDNLQPAVAVAATSTGTILTVYSGGLGQVVFSSGVTTGPQSIATSSINYQSFAGGNNNPTFSFNGGGGSTVLVMIVQPTSTTESSVTIQGVGALTEGHRQVNGSGPTSTQIYYSTFSTPSGAMTIQANASTGNFFEITMVSLTGAKISAPVDVSTGAINSGTIITSTVTTSVANDVLFSAMINNNQGVTLTCSGTETSIGGTNTDPNHFFSGRFCMRGPLGIGTAYSTIIGGASLSQASMSMVAVQPGP